MKILFIVGVLVGFVIGFALLSVAFVFVFGESMELIGYKRDYRKVCDYVFRFENLKIEELEDAKRLSLKYSPVEPTGTLLIDLKMSQTKLRNLVRY